MLKVNGVDIENVKFNGTKIDKIVINGTVFFEKKHIQKCIMQTFNNVISLFIVTKDNTPCEVWNSGFKIGVAESQQKTTLSVFDKNKDIVIIGFDIITLVCNDNQLQSLNVESLTNLQFLQCNNNQLQCLNVEGLTNLQFFNCSKNYITEKAFINLLNNLPEKNGEAVLYDYDDGNADYSSPEMTRAFNGAKRRGWKFYKYSISHTLITI